MSYIVLTKFADLTDNKHLYEAGDMFPREGLEVDEKRLQELCSRNNRMWKAVIKEIADDPDGDLPASEELVRPKSKKVSRKNKNQ